MTRILSVVAALVALTAAQQQDPGILSDPGHTVRQAEIVHLYYDQWPTGKSVTASSASADKCRYHCVPIWSHVLKFPSCS